MRTTLDLHDGLVAQAKAYAALYKLTLTAFIEEAMRARLEAKPAARKPRTPMPIFLGGNGLAPGLSGNSTREMMEILDEEDDPRLRGQMAKPKARASGRSERKS